MRLIITIPLISVWGSVCVAAIRVSTVGGCCGCSCGVVGAGRNSMLATHWRSVTIQDIHKFIEYLTVCVFEFYQIEETRRG